jgi:elongation factor P--(R)-beta-lysine ligase
MLGSRASLLRDLREFFHQRNVLEVTTPVIAAAGVSDLHLSNLTVQLQQRTGYLQTSPEYAMKRLLAAGSGPIFQICPAFRGGESGSRHSVEFSMLEWYRPGMTFDDLIEEVCALLVDVCQLPVVNRRDYGQVFMQYTGLDPHCADLSALKAAVARHGIDASHIDDIEDAGSSADYLDLLFSTQVEPVLQSCVITDFPACQAALAKVVTNDAGTSVARRFEVYIRGVELANGYDELTDSVELRQRFKSNNMLRRRRHLPEIPADERLLAALPAMGACSGVAVGVDRMLMLMMGVDDLAQVMPFAADQ